MMGSDLQKSAFAEVDAKTTPLEEVRAGNSSLILNEYVMDGDIDLIQTINRIIAATYQE